MDVENYSNQMAEEQTKKDITTVNQFLLMINVLIFLLIFVFSLFQPRTLKLHFIFFLLCNRSKNESKTSQNGSQDIKNKVPQDFVGR